MRNHCLESIDSTFKMIIITLSSPCHRWLMYFLQRPCEAGIDADTGEAVVDTDEAGRGGAPGALVNPGGEGLHPRLSW